MLLKSKFFRSGIYLSLSMALTLLAGCTSSSNSSSNVGPTAHPADASSASLADLQNKHFRLRQNLSFASAYRHKAQTMLGEDVVRLSRYYENQREVDGQSLAATDSYCELYIETAGSDSTSDLHFTAGQSLLLAQVSQANSNGSYSFTLALQVGMFQDIMVSCQNVPSSAALDAQVGQIIEITDQTVAPAPSSVGDFGRRIQFFQDQGGPRFGITYSDSADAMWGLTASFRSGDLQDQSNITAVAWRLWDASASSYINDWRAAAAPGAASSAGLPAAVIMELNVEADILHAIRADRSLLLVLAINGDVNADLQQSRPSRYVDLGVLCQSRPTNFSDVSGETALVGCR